MLTSEYRRLRRLGWASKDAARAARVKERFEDAEDAGLVRLRVLPDDCCEPDDFDGTPAQHTEALERASRDGCWGIVADYRCPACGNWASSDSVWGFIGDDWRDSGYDTDVMACCLAAAAEVARQSWPGDFALPCKHFDLAA